MIGSPQENAPAPRSAQSSPGVAGSSGAGFGLPLAHALACDRRKDVHPLLDIVDQGFPPALAVSILGSLEEEVEVA